MVLTLTHYFGAEAVNVSGILEGTLDGGTRRSRHPNWRST